MEKIRHSSYTPYVIILVLILAYGFVLYREFLRGEIEADTPFRMIAIGFYGKIHDILKKIKTSLK